VSWSPLIWFGCVVSFHIGVETTLTLRDKQGRETGSLVVLLLDLTAGTTQAAVDVAGLDVGQRQSTSPAVPEPVQNATDLATTVPDSDDGTINLLKQVVDKTKLVANSVSKRSKVHIAPPQCKLHVTVLSFH